MEQVQEDSDMEELKSIQKELDKRTKLESEVIELIS